MTPVEAMKISPGFAPSAVAAASAVLSARRPYR
jgi:hypothetical protein